MKCNKGANIMILLFIFTAWLQCPNYNTAMPILSETESFTLIIAGNSTLCDTSWWKAFDYYTNLLEGDSF